MGAGENCGTALGPFNPSTLPTTSLADGAAAARRPCPCSPSPFPPQSHSQSHSLPIAIPDHDGWMSDRSTPPQPNEGCLGRRRQHLPFPGSDLPLGGERRRGCWWLLLLVIVGTYIGNFPNPASLSKPSNPASLLEVSGFTVQFGENPNAELYWYDKHIRAYVAAAQHMCR
jgi:hypothetical protein